MTVRFLLHANSLSERGDTVTLREIGLLLWKEFGYPPTIAYYEPSSSSWIESVQEFRKLGFPIYGYRIRSELETIAIENNISHTYVFSDGTKSGLAYTSSRDNDDWRLGNSIHITHVVFRNFEPHGDYYLFVSDWLYSWAKPRIVFWKNLQRIRSFLGYPQKSIHFDSWPHFVSIQNSDKTRRTLRDQLGIGGQELVIGRIGGFDQFSDQVAKEGVQQLLQMHSNLHFIFVNTQVFIDHPRVHFLPKMRRDEVVLFYNAIDIAVNGRIMGESFGYGIVESLMMGKPIVAPHWIRNVRMDKNHITILKQFGTLYWSKKTFIGIMNELIKRPIPAEVLNDSVKVFSPDIAAAKLKKILRI
jgi:hypothetical protein